MIVGAPSEHRAERNALHALGYAESYRRWGGAFALAVVVWLIDRSPILNPPDPFAEAAAVVEGIAYRQVWADEKSEFFGRISADGRYLSFPDWATANLGLRDLVQDTTRLLTDDGTWETPRSFAFYSVLSPDGRHIVYTQCCHDGDKFELRLTQVGEGIARPRTLLKDEEITYIQPAGWTPDGKEILAQIGRVGGTSELAMISAENGSLRVVKSLDRHRLLRALLSPDGKWIVYELAQEVESINRDVYVLAAEGSQHRSVVRHPADDRVLGFAPGGDRLIFSSDRLGTIDVWSIAIENGRTSGDPVLLKSELGHFMWPPGITADGTLFLGRQIGGSNVHLAEYDSRTGAVQGKPRLVSKTFQGRSASPVWSRDGSKIAYLSRRDKSALFLVGKRVLVIQSADGDTLRELDLRLNVSTRHSLVWSPDGTQVLIEVWDSKGGSGLWEADVVSGELRSIVLMEADSKPSNGVYSLDGHSLYYVLASKHVYGEIHERDLQSHEVQVLHRGVKNDRFTDLTLSPDGNTLALVSGNGLSNAISLIPIEGGEPSEILRVEGTSQGKEIRGLAWSHDGKHLIYSEHPGRGNLQSWWRLPLEGGEPEPMGLKTGRSPNHSVHPDGGKILYAETNVRSEIWALENFLGAKQAGR